MSRFGVISKPHQPGKWRLITDLSSPKGASVNDGINSHFLFVVLCIRRRRCQDGPAPWSRLCAGQVRSQGGVSDRPSAPTGPPIVGHDVAKRAVR